MKDPNPNSMPRLRETAPVVLKPELIVISQKGCGRCELLKRMFEQNGTYYTEMDISAPLAKDYIMKSGAMNLPVALLRNNADGSIKLFAHGESVKKIYEAVIRG